MKYFLPKSFPSVSSIGSHAFSLSRLVLQSADNPDALTCKVCSAQYMVEKGSQFSLAQGFTVKQWIVTGTIVTAMCLTVGGCWAVVHLYPQPWIRGLAVGLALLVMYICLRSLGLNTVNAYQRAKVSALKIVNLKRRRLNELEEEEEEEEEDGKHPPTVVGHNLQSLRSATQEQDRL